MSTNNPLKFRTKPEDSLMREVSWFSGAVPFQNKIVNSSLKIGLISSARLQRGLENEADIFILTEENWPFMLKYGGLSFLLVETCLDTSTGDWQSESIGASSLESGLGKLLALARAKGIPTVYWFTMDHEYHDLFSVTAAEFDYVFCADEREIPLLAKGGIKAKYLPPAFQPALHSPLKPFRPNPVQGRFGFCDGLADIISCWHERSQLVRCLAEMGVCFGDSCNEIWKTKVRDIDIPRHLLFGTLTFEARLDLLKSAKVYCMFNSDRMTRTLQQWLAVEAAGCRTPVICRGQACKDVFLGEFAQMADSDDSFILDLIRHQKDPLYTERRGQQAWRAAHRKHTFAHRIRTICEALGIYHDWEEFPSATLIAPTFREANLEKLISQYEAMNYPNKRLTIVYNGTMEQSVRVKERMSSISGCKALYAPQELPAGACMNIGIRSAETDYVFRMDDDDFYGENYLLDTMLYTRIADFDLSGKVFRYFLLIGEDGESSVYNRAAKHLDFHRPAFVEADNFPTDFTMLSGATQGGRTEFFKQYAYSNTIFGAADMQFLDQLRHEKAGRAIILDDMNFVVERRLTGDHTWKHDMKSFVEESSCELSMVEEISRT